MPPLARRKTGPAIRKPFSCISGHDGGAAELVNLQTQREKYLDLCSVTLAARYGLSLADLRRRVDVDLPAWPGRASIELHLETAQAVGCSLVRPAAPSLPLQHVATLTADPTSLESPKGIGEGQLRPCLDEGIREPKGVVAVCNGLTCELLHLGVSENRGP